MKAMIFAAGIGSRLRPLTDTMPKALVPVGGVPMLQRVILRLKESGFTEITVNIHHFGEQILSFLNANAAFGVTIHISDERGRLLDTGGGILKARPFLDGSEPFLVHNVDIASDVDLAAMYRQHLAGTAAATLLVSDRDTSRKLIFKKDDDDSTGQHDAGLRLCGWTNLATGEVRPQGFVPEEDKCRKLAFGGIHVISPELFNYMGTGTEWQGAFPIVPFYLDVCTHLKLAAYMQPDIHWFDIGKPDTLARADAYYSQK